jgi:gluconokinase
MVGMSLEQAAVVTLDVGTSSVRTLLFDSHGWQQDWFGEQIHYQFTTTPEGGVELEADQLVDISLRSLHTIHEQLREARLKPAAVGFSSFWHSLLGVDRAENPTTPLLHLFDTRSASQVEELKQRLDFLRTSARRQLNRGRSPVFVLLGIPAAAALDFERYGPVADPILALA